MWLFGPKTGGCAQVTVFKLGFDRLLKEKLTVLPSHDEKIYCLLSCMINEKLQRAQRLKTGKQVARFCQTVTQSTHQNLWGSPTNTVYLVFKMNRDRSVNCCFYWKLYARLILGWCQQISLSSVRDNLGTVPVLIAYEGDSQRTDAANCIWNPLTWCIIKNVMLKNWIHLLVQIFD